MRIAAANLGVFVPALWAVPQNPVVPEMDSMGLGRFGLGDVMCPDGTNQPTLNDCIDHGYVDTGIVPGGCPSGFALDPSGAVCIPSGGSTASTPAPSSGGGITLSFPFLTPSPTPGAPVAAGGCPTGFVMLAGGGVCIPANSPAAVAQANPKPASNMPAWALPAGIAAAVLLVGVVMMRR